MISNKKGTRSERHKKILELVSSGRIATQGQLVAELSKRGIRVTQPSVSRDMVELGLVKVGGRYLVPRSAVTGSGPILEVDTAGDNLIVVKTEVGQAQPVALTIDRAKIAEVVGTVAGDDTIMVAVKNAAAARLAMRKIVKLFGGAGRAGRRK